MNAFDAVPHLLRPPPPARNPTTLLSTPASPDDPSGSQTAWAHAVQLTA